jgi:hypothetical protein
MVEVSLEGDMVVFNVKGLHKLWALKSRLEIPREHIRSVRHDPSVVHGWKGWKAPGTYVPGLIVAGTFYLDGQTIFWDVSHAERAVVIELEDEDYKRLIVEVEDPEAVVQMLGGDPDADAFLGEPEAQDAGTHP